MFKMGDPNEVAVTGQPSTAQTDEKNEPIYEMQEIKLDQVDVVDRAELYKQAVKEDNISAWAKSMLIMYLMLFIAMMSAYNISLCEFWLTRA